MITIHNVETGEIETREMNAAELAEHTAMKERYEKGLARFNPKELGITEYTRLQMRTPSFKKMIEELKTMPKRENLI